MRATIPVTAMVLLVAAGMPPGPLAAQDPQEVPGGREAGSGVVEHPLTLSEALRRARDRNASLRMAGADARAAAGRAGVARSALLPRLDLEAGWLRTDDPVAAFGTKLRQRRFGSADLALGSLNRPAPVDDWTAGLGLRWGALDPAAWKRSAAAERARDAAELSARRAGEATDFRTRVLYVEASAAEARLAAARAAREAARATLDRFRRRHDEGLLTRAEMLQGRAELEAARAEVERARGDRNGARLLLGVHLGWGADTVPVPSEALAMPAATASRTGGGGGPEGRTDLRALRARVEAAEASVGAARAEFLPAAHLFGRLDRHAVEPLGAGGTTWSVGVGVRIPAFSGGEREARAEVATAELRSARASLDLAERDAAADVVRALEDLAAARLAVEASRSARDAAEEGRELMRRRFEEGLASAADLLDAESRTAAMQGRFVEALAGYHMARARLDYVSAPGEEER